MRAVYNTSKPCTEPPYHIESDGNTRTRNIYHLFVERAIAMQPQYVLMITPSHWFGGAHLRRCGARQSRLDNIIDGILKLYRDAVGDQVSKDDIFYCVYSLLHDPAYRQIYAADLKKMLPHIPTPENRERFEQLAGADRKLAELHVGYETVDPYPLEVQLKSGTDPDRRET